jgi:hypothetical protein
VRQRRKATRTIAGSGFRCNRSLNAPATAYNNVGAQVQKTGKQHKPVELILESFATQGFQENCGSFPFSESSWNNTPEYVWHHRLVVLPCAG